MLTYTHDSQEFTLNQCSSKQLVLDRVVSISNESTDDSYMPETHLTIPKFVKLVVFSYLPLDIVLSKIAVLSKTMRDSLRSSGLARSQTEV